MTTKTKVNPDKIVTTISGERCKRSECRFIKRDYHKINKDCFKINGRWYRTNCGLIVKDHETGKWDLKENLIHGLVLENNKVELGYFTSNIERNVPISLKSAKTTMPLELKSASTSNGVLYGVSEEVANALNLEEELGSGIFKAASPNNRTISTKNTYDFLVDYSFENSAEEIQDLYQKRSKSITPDVQNGNLIKHSFGWEFETTDGYIHPRHLVKGGLIPLRDGSITGYEYVTVPLRGPVGLYTTKIAAQLLSKYTAKNKMCSLHLHLGNLPVSEEYLKKAYNLCTAVQDEIYSMFPPDLKHTSLYKARDYCNMLPKGAKFAGDRGVANIINHFAGHSDYYENHYSGLGAKPHPSDTDNRHKWNIGARYVWCNFVPYIFSKRHTIEFRIHTPTTNKYKLINWLFICSAILKYAEKEAMPSPTTTLQQILTDVYPTYIAQYLIDYVEDRKKMVQRSVTLGDTVGEIEINNDLNYRFIYDRSGETLID